jgi:hypothetical protein
MDKAKIPRKASKTPEDPIPQKSVARDRSSMAGNSFVPPKQYEAARLPNSFAFASFFRQPVKKADKGFDDTGTYDTSEVVEIDEFLSELEDKPPFTLKGAPAKGRMGPYAIHRSFGSVLEGMKTSHLVSVDEEVLIALLAMAAVKIRRFEYEPQTKQPERDESPRACLGESKQTGMVIGFEFQRSELAQLLGWGLNKVSYEAIFHSLVRLQAARFREPISPDSPIEYKQTTWSSRIIGFTEVLYRVEAGDPEKGSPDDTEWIPQWQPKSGKTAGKSTSAMSVTNVNARQVKWAPTEKVEVILCRHLSEIVLSPDTKTLYGLHLMSERSQLSPFGRTLYTQIVAQVRPGQERTVHLDTLLRKARGKFPTATERSAALKILTKKWLKSEGWVVTSSGRAEKTDLRVKRPSLPAELQTQRAAITKKAKSESNDEME